MSQRIDVEVDGTIVQIEVESPAGFERTSVDDGEQSPAIAGFERAKKTVCAVASSMLKSFLVIPENAPDELELQFGIKFTASGSVFIAKAGSETTLGIRLLYRKPS